MTHLCECFPGKCSCFLFAIFPRMDFGAEPHHQTLPETKLPLRWLDACKGLSANFKGVYTYLGSIIINIYVFLKRKMHTWATNLTFLHLESHRRQWWQDMTKESTWLLTVAGSWEGVWCCSPITPQCLWPSWVALCSGWWMQWSGPASLRTTQCQCLTPSTDICTGGRGKVLLLEPGKSVRALMCSHTDFMFIITFYLNRFVLTRCQWRLKPEWTFGR